MIKRAHRNDIPKIFEFIKIHWKDRSKYQVPKRWKWLFELNPFLKENNKLPIWLSLDGKNIIGHTAAMVVPLKINGETYQAGWSIMTLVHSKHRGKKIGYHLQKNNQKAWPIFMSLSMSKANRNIKIKLGGREYLNINVFKLRISMSLKTFEQSLYKRLRKILSNNNLELPRFIFKILFHVINFFIKLNFILKKKYFLKTKNDLFFKKIKNYQKEWGLIFNNILDKKIFVERSADYLNWKYISQPHINYQNFIINDKRGQIIGYIVLRLGVTPLESKFGLISDLVLRDNDIDYQKQAILFSLNYFQKKKCEYIKFASQSDKIKKILIKIGFSTNKITPVVYCKNKMLTSKLLNSKWHFGLGDHDWDTFPSKH